MEGLEGLALQRGLDPADPALASSSADVPEARPEPITWQGKTEVVGDPASSRSAPRVYS